MSHNIFEADPAPKTLWPIVEHQTIDKVLEASHSECNTPLPEPFRIRIRIVLQFMLEELCSTLNYE
jgi:hypothetical protein